ncbi:MAG: hypothetical protein Q8Q73_16405 [Stagnimonas sp.]|nr:hypothetical protein [Stagnimonas sp.]
MTGTSQAARGSATGGFLLTAKKEIARSASTKGAKVPEADIEYSQLFPFYHQSFVKATSAGDDFSDSQTINYGPIKRS